MCLNTYSFKIAHSSKAHMFSSLGKLRHFLSWAPTSKISQQQRSWEQCKETKLGEISGWGSIVKQALYKALGASSTAQVTNTGEQMSSHA